MNALNPAQGYRKKLVREALGLGAGRPPFRVLELGSGSGELAVELLRERPDVEFVGLDLSAVGVEQARRKAPAATFFQQDFTRPIQLEDRFRGWATHVVCTEVLEHLDDPVATLQNVRPFFARGCKVVITVPAGPMSAYDRHIGHRRHYSVRRLGEVLRAAGLEVADVKGAGFPFFNVYRLAVVARGRRLIEDTSDKDALNLRFQMRAAMAAFSWLFRLNLPNTKLGWQLVAVGVEP